MKKNKGLWLALFILIAVPTIWAVISQSGSFDGEELLKDFKESNKIWLILALLASLANIVFEAITLKTIIRIISPDYKGKGRYLLYSSADIYFSAITPFTSGGQPAMAYFMLKDKISIAAITTSLILDYIACTVTNLFCFLIGIIIFPTFVAKLSTLSIVLTIIGASILLILNIALVFLLIYSSILRRITTSILKFLNRIFHFKNMEKKLNKIDLIIEDYRQCSLTMKNNKRLFFKTFLLTLVQKFGKALSTVFIFFAIIKVYSDGFKVWCIQIFSDIGASFFPVPGGIGAREFIIIDGFSNLSAVENAANLGLICQTFSFYFGVLVSGLIVLSHILFLKKKEKTIEQNKTSSDN